MNEAQMWERIRNARVGVLGTIRPDGSPHQVPFVYAAVSDRVLVSAVDSKPKSGRRLARLVNIEAEPRVSVLVQLVCAVVGSSRRACGGQRRRLFRPTSRPGGEVSGLLPA
jgi:hypothetical protein